MPGKDWPARQTPVAGARDHHHRAAHSCLASCAPRSTSSRQPFIRSWERDWHADQPTGRVAAGGRRSADPHGPTHCRGEQLRLAKRSGAQTVLSLATAASGISSGSASPRRVTTTRSGGWPAPALDGTIRHASEDPKLRRRTRWLVRSHDAQTDQARRRGAGHTRTHDPPHGQLLASTVKPTVSQQLTGIIRETGFQFYHEHARHASDAESAEVAAQRAGNVCSSMGWQRPHAASRCQKWRSWKLIA